MVDSISLIASDGFGHPEVDGPHGHFVLVTDNPNPARVNQLSDGGRYPNADCADACVESVLRDRNVNDTAVTIEEQLGTTRTGTQLQPLVDGINRILGDGAATLVEGTPTRNNVMNPLGGIFVPAVGWAPYGAASQGWYVRINKPRTVGVPTPVPTPTPIPVDAGEEDDMARLVTAGVRPATEGQDPHGNGAVYLVNDFEKRWIPNGAILAQYTPVYGSVKQINAFVLDAMFEDPDVAQRMEEAAADFEADKTPDTE